MPHLLAAIVQTWLILNALALAIIIVRGAWYGGD